MKPIFGILFTAASLFAQITGVNATITGVVTDPRGGPVPRAVVVATNVDTKSPVGAISNGVGAYTFANIPPAVRLMPTHT